MRARETSTPVERVLEGRVVLVTGAAGALGQASALAAAAAGAVLVLCGRRVRPLEQLFDQILAAGGAEPAIYPIDLEGATPAQYQELVAAIADQLGRLDGLVHAAARFTGLVPHAEIDPADWLRGIQVNLHARWALTQAALPLLRQRSDAAVVLVLDDPARVGKAFWGDYGVAQFAQRGLLSQWAAEFDPGSVRVHGLVPPPLRSALRQRAYFAENPARIAGAEAAALRVVRERRCRNSAACHRCRYSRCGGANR